MPLSPQVALLTGGLVLLTVISGCTAQSPTRATGPAASAAPGARGEPGPVPPVGSSPPVRTGMVRLDTSSCTGPRSGSGFLISTTLVVTAAPVVDAAATVRVTHGLASTGATVIGFDAATGVALLRTSQPLIGHFFTLDPAGPQVGERVRAIEPDAPTHQLTHGMPLVSVTGKVVGLISASRSPVSTAVAEPRIRAWQAQPAPVPPTGCPPERAPGGQVVAADGLPSGVGAAIAETMNLYARSLNQGDYATAYAQLHPTAQLRTSLEAFTRRTSASSDTQVRYRDVRRTGQDVVLWSTFRSALQPTHGPDGLTFANQSVDVTLRHSDGLWLILSTQPHTGAVR